MDEPAFHEPWHAQVFAITVHLHQLGLIDWPIGPPDLAKLLRGTVCPKIWTEAMITSTLGLRR